MAELRWFKAKSSSELNDGCLYIYGGHGSSPVASGLYDGRQLPVADHWFAGPVEIASPAPIQCTGCKTPEAYSEFDSSYWVCLSRSHYRDCVYVRHKNHDVAIGAHNAAVLFINEFESGQTGS